MKHRVLLLIILISALLIFKIFFMPAAQPGKPERSVLQTLKALTNRAEPSPAGLVPTPTSETPQSDVSAEFRRWFESETRELEQQQNDTTTVENLLRIKAESLSLQEVLFLKKKVLESPVANEKIISVYMLSLAERQEALSSLAEISNQQAQYPSPQPVHSPEETLSMQEKTIKRMALDALFEKAQKSSEARQLFHENIDRISDPELRAYAQRKDRELP